MLGACVGSRGVMHELLRREITGIEVLTEVEERAMFPGG